MGDRIEMLEATLDLIDGGVAVLDDQTNVLFWNHAASALTGYLAHDVLGMPCPEALYSVAEDRRDGVGLKARHIRKQERNDDDTMNVGATVRQLVHPTALLDCNPDDVSEFCRLPQSPFLVAFHHKLGHTVPGMLRRVTLRDDCSQPMGTALLFYPVEEVDTLPHGETGGGGDIERSQAEMEDRLEAAHHQWRSGAIPFGLLWITVDQAQSLRTTHGRDACEAMLRTVEQTLVRHLKPTEVLGRWGDNEFLVVAHERTTELLVDHARRLAGLARTADFRWWGDRVGLTTSIGISQAMEGDSLQALLNRARQAMRTSAYAGGNQVTEAREM